MRFMAHLKAIKLRRIVQTYEHFFFSFILFSLVLLPVLVPLL